MKKNFLTVSALLVSMGILLTPTIQVNAETIRESNKTTTVNYNLEQNYITPQEEAIIRKEFKSDKLDDDVIEKLIDKIKKGEMLDSEKPEMIEKIPKDFFKFDKSNESKIEEKTYKFDDGSYIKVKSIPAFNSNKLLKQYGNYDYNKTGVNKIERSHYATLYQDEYVEAKYGKGTRIGFYATFGFYNQSNSRLENAYGTSGWGLGSWSYNDPDIIRPVQSGSSPALATANATQSTGIGNASKTSGFTCKLEVYKNSYNVSIVKH